MHIETCTLLSSVATAPPVTNYHLSGKLSIYKYHWQHSKKKVLRICTFKYIFGPASNNPATVAPSFHYLFHMFPKVGNNNIFFLLHRYDHIIVESRVFSIENSLENSTLMSTKFLTSYIAGCRKNAAKFWLEYLINEECGILI